MVAWAKDVVAVERSRVKELAQALLEVQRAMPAVDKDSKASVPTKNGGKYEYEYVSLDHLLKVALPILHAHDVVLVQAPTIGALKTLLIHSPSGEQIESEMNLMLPQENPQGQGSAITYARRYALTAILGISGQKDDDGALASQKPKPKADTAKSKRSKLEARLEELAAEADAKRDVAGGVTFGEVQVRLGDAPDEQKLIEVGLDLADWLTEGCPCPFHEYTAVKF